MQEAFHRSGDVGTARRPRKSLIRRFTGGVRVPDERTIFARDCGGCTEAKHCLPCVRMPPAQERSDATAEQTHFVAAKFPDR
jgi:hypothetical protein